MRTALATFAAGRPRVFVVTAAGGAAARVAVERELGRRRWPTAASPADADAVAVCGDAAPLAPYVDAVWRQVAAPKARADVTAPAGAARALSEAQRALRDGPRGDGGHRGHEGRDMSAMTSHDMSGHDMGSSCDDVSGHDMSGHDMGGHEGHDMGGHDMGGHGMHDMEGMEVAGLAIASRADDRDGLKLDRLHVPLGPALPGWPAGLVVRTTVQGDVIQSAGIETLLPSAPAAEPPFWREHPRARHLDVLARFLAVAGRGDAAAAARRLRDAALDGDVPAARIERFATRARRSRTLRWLTRGLGVVDSGDAPLAGDVWDRFQWRLRAAVEGAAEPPHAARVLELLPDLLVGTDLFGARLIVASFDPDLDELAHG